MWGAPRAVRLPPHNLTLDLRSHRASRSRRGDVPRGGRTNGRQWVWTAGTESRRKPQHPPDRRTNASASAVPVRAPGAPLLHDNRPRAGLRVATVGKVCRLISVQRYRRGGPLPMRGSRPARQARCASRRRRPFDEYDAPGRPPVQAPPAMGGDVGAPRAVRLPPHNPTMDLRSHGASRSRRGKENHGGEIRTDDNGYGQPGRRAEGTRSTYRIDVLTRPRRQSPF